MVNRTTVSGSSTPPLSGPDFLDEYAERIDTLFDASTLALTSVGGTANAVTATLDPALATSGVFVDGMKFTLTWAAANTGGVTLAINGGAALPVVDASGTALAAGVLTAGLRSLLEFVGGSFRVLTLASAGAGGGSARYYEVFTASGTWTKPAGLDEDTMVIVEMWAGGGGGSSAGSGGGGGGGGYIRHWFRAGDLPASVAVTVGAGGAVNTGGGNSTFGSLLTAYGGGPGDGSDGGGGGGLLGAGGNPTAGSFGGGAGGTGAVPGAPPTNENGGGGGGGVGAGSYSGAGAVRGGAGGSGGSGTGSAATSLFGGNGGAQTVAGAARGGGGGRNAAGGRGEVRVWI